MFIANIRIKLTPDNWSKVSYVLDEVQRRASKRLLIAADVIALADAAERALEGLKLPRARRAGARYEFSADGGIQGVSNAYKKKAGPRDATYVLIERGASAWYLIAVSRVGYWPGRDGNDNFILTDAQKVEVVANFAAGLTVFSYTAHRLTNPPQSSAA